MIKVFFNDEDISHSIFEFVRLQFPSYDKKNKDINIYISEESRLKIEFKSKNFSKIFFVEKVKEKKEQKILIKQKLYSELKPYFEQRDPWGVLTGVRPTKLVLNLLEEYDEKEVVSILKNKYLLDNNSINLCMDIAKKEINYIYPVNKNRYSLYIHIPFCPSKCSYCSFLTMKNEKIYTKKYTEVLIEELKKNSENILNSPRSVYIGGGTPTSLEDTDLEKIISTINSYYGNSKEFTVECGRPDTISYDTLSMLKQNNVDRISINPQTMKDETLKLIGRSHSVKDIVESYNMAKKIEFKSINMDLILGLPGENKNDVKNTLEEIFKLNPENITIHTLAIKNGSLLYEENYDNIGESKEILDLTKKLTNENKYYPYYMYRQKRMLGNGENIGYSKEGFESIYNMAMMEEKESILGFGMCSTSKFFYPNEKKIKKVMHFRNLNDYYNKNNEISEKRLNYIKDFKF